MGGGDRVSSFGRVSGTPFSTACSSCISFSSFANTGTHSQSLTVQKRWALSRKIQHKSQGRIWRVFHTPASTDSLFFSTQPLTIGMLMSGVLGLSCSIFFNSILKIRDAEIIRGMCTKRLFGLRERYSLGKWYCWTHLETRLVGCSLLRLLGIRIFWEKPPARLLGKDMWWKSRKDKSPSKGWRVQSLGSSASELYRHSYSASQRTRPQDSTSQIAADISNRTSPVPTGRAWAIISAATTATQGYNPHQS